MEIHIRDMGISRRVIEKGIKAQKQLFAKDHPMSGWVGASEMEANANIDIIKNIANKIKEQCELLIVIGIGGSTIGPKTLVNLFEKTTSTCQVIFCGDNLDIQFHKKMFSYIETKEVALCVISKSGETLETKVIFEQYEEKLKKEYGEKKTQERIYVITSKQKNFLRNKREQRGYVMLDIPENIVGRYGIFTGKALLPLAVAGGDIDQFLHGGIQAAKDEKVLQMALDYACARVEMFSQGKVVEAFASFSRPVYLLEKWIQQLIAESEGKEGKGIFLIMVQCPEVFHSIGQYVRGGSPIFFETGIYIKDTLLEEKENPLEKLKQGIMSSVLDNYKKDNRPVILIGVEIIEEKAMGELMYFFQLAASLSAYMMDVNPFNQPDVEVYKKDTIEII